MSTSFTIYGVKMKILHALSLSFKLADGELYIYIILYSIILYYVISYYIILYYIIIRWNRWVTWTIKKMGLKLPLHLCVFYLLLGF
jgi:hypothetical protein